MAVAVTSSGYIRSGSRSFHITVGNAAEADSNGWLLTNIFRQVSLTAGKSCTFSGYFKNTTAGSFNSKSQAYLQVSNPSMTRLALSTMITSCTSPDIEDGWTRLSTTFTAPVDGSYTLFVRTNWIYGRSCFDDLQLEEGSSASGYNLLVGGDAEWADDWTFSTGSVQGSDGVRIVNSAGVVRAEYTYNAWGELPAVSGAVCDLNPLRCRGYVYDDETGLYYLNSRYYDPGNRRIVNTVSYHLRMIRYRFLLARLALSICHTDSIQSNTLLNVGDSLRSFKKIPAL